VRDRDAVVVIGHAFWRTRLDSNPRVVGQSISINGRSFAIVGVAPPGFGGVLQGGGTSDVWIPSAMFRVGYRYCDAFAPDCTIVQILGRLKDGVALSEARSELDVLARQLERSYPSSHDGLGIVAVPARGTYPAEQESSVRTTGVLLAAVVMVLLVACANVGGLLLVRGVKRRREIAIRLALGANRGRVVRQLLTEAAVLAIAGGALAILVATWANETLRSFYAVDYAGRRLEFEVGLRPWVLAVTGGLSLLTALLCGLVPALLGSATNVVGALKDESGSGATRRSWFRDGLVVFQVACSLVLLVGAGLLVRSLLDITRGPGVDASRIVILRLRPSLVAFDGARARAFQREVIRRLEALPGVEAASPGDGLPLFGWGTGNAVSRGDGPAEGPSLQAAASRIGDGYFKVLGLPILEGRDFDSRDLAAGQPVAIVNDVLARQLWPGEPATGRRVRLDGRTHHVVGVVRAAQYHTIAESLLPYVYLNYWQQHANGGWSSDSRTHVRVRGDAAAMMAAIRREVAAVDPTVPISEDYPLEDRVAFTFRRVRMMMTLLVAFGGLALVLAATGLYAVVAFATSLRVREIAIRIALGARPDQVRALVLGQGTRMVLLGTALGLAGALASARLLSTMLYGVQPYDAVTFAGAAVVLVAVAVLASALPARRAVRLEPARTLRAE
jgi:predicted permease